jgi:hypothetical protein
MSAMRDVSLYFKVCSTIPSVFCNIPDFFIWFQSDNKATKKARKKRNKRRRIKKQGKECKKAKARIALIFNK